jgi:hypothetical protein
MFRNKKGGPDGEIVAKSGFKGPSGSVSAQKKATKVPEKWKF